MAWQKGRRAPPLGARLCDLLCFPEQSLALDTHYKQQDRARPAYPLVNKAAPRPRPKVHPLSVSGSLPHSLPHCLCLADSR